MDAIALRLIPLFWAKVSKTDSCWNWTASKFWCGYGRFAADRVGWYAHRLSWTIHYGKIPTGMLVLHHCDNRSCVRPDHLFLGTHKTNRDDCISKGRANPLRGEHHPNARLSRDDVAEIRRLCKIALFSHREIGEQFGIKQAQVSRINVGLSWVDPSP
jgi:hypothetical protein